METVKKSILFHWMHKIFVTKDISKSEFTDKNAIDILNAANFNIPYSKAIKPFLKEVTDEFKEALKQKKVSELLDAYPLPNFLVGGKTLQDDEEEELEIEFDEGVEEITEGIKNIPLKEEELVINGMIVKDYSDKSFAVSGNTWALKDELKQLGGKFNKNLKGGAAYIFSNKKKDAVVRLLKGEKEEEEILPPSMGEIKTIAEHIINTSDLETTSSKDIIKMINEHFGMDLSEYKKEIKKMIKSILSSYQQPAEEQKEEEIIIEEDVDIPMIVPSVKPKKVKKEKRVVTADEHYEERRQLRQQYWNLWTKLENIQANINRDVPFTYDSYNNVINPTLKASIDEYKKEYKQVLEEFLEVDNKLYELPGTAPTDRMDELKKQEKADKKKQVAPMKGLLNSILQSTHIPGNVSSLTKENLAYIAFLTYYAISPIINVEDPSLENTYKQYPDLEANFKSRFSMMSIAQRYEFIKTVLNGRSFEKINNLIVTGQPLNPKNGMEISIPVTISETEIKPLKIEDELKYNLMYYIKPHSHLSKDAMIKQADIALLNRTKTTESVADKIDLGVSADMKDILEKVHTTQLINIKDMLRGNKLLDESDEEQHKIQSHYEEVRPPLKLDDMTEVMGRGNITVTSFRSYIPVTDSELKAFVKALKNKTIAAEIYAIKSELLVKVNKMNKKEKKEAELKYIKDKVNAGEITQIAGSALEFFIGLYDSVDRLPSKNDVSMFKYEDINDLPEIYKKEAERDIKILIARNKQLHDKEMYEERDILSQIQKEIYNKKVDITSVADKINKLNKLSQTDKNKMLEQIQRGTVNNIYFLYKSLTIKILRNPLEYTGAAKRASRIEKSRNELNELDKIKASFPKMTHSVSQCMTHLFLKPWLNLPADYRYFIFHPNDIEKSDMDETERFMYGNKIGQGGIPDVKNAYVPTTLFWRVYCTEFMSNVNGKTACKSDHYNLVNKKVKMGVYNDEGFKILKKEDFDAECEWFKSNDANLRSLSSVSSIDLNMNLKLARNVRESMRNKIKNILNLLYTEHNIPVKYENKVEQTAKIIEAELFDSSRVGKSVILAGYVFNVNRFLFLIDPASPLYQYTKFFQRLVLTTAKASFGKIVELSKNVSESFPEIFLSDNKQELSSLIERKIREDSNEELFNIFNAVEGIRRDTNVVTKFRVTNDDINNKLASFDHKKFKNVCVNYSEVDEPYFVSKVGKDVYCVNKYDFYNVINGSLEATLHIPDEVKQTILGLNVSDKSSELARLFEIQYIGNLVAKKNYLGLAFLIDDMDDIEKGEIESIEVEQGISWIESNIGTLSEKERVLFINHIILEGYHTLLNRLKIEVDKYELSGELKEKLMKEYTQRKNRFNDIERLMVVDKTERIALLHDFFKHLENMFGELNDTIKEVVVEYFDKKHIQPLVKGMKDDRQVELLDHPSCSVCHKDITGLKLDTYLYKDGKKQLARFCSYKCMGKLDENALKIVKKDEMKDIELNILVDKIVRPMPIGYYELLDRTKLIGMNLPDDIPFEQIYASWLSNSMFSDKIWLEYFSSEIHEIAKRYNVVSDDTSDAWKQLKQNVNFTTKFSERIEETLSRPYSRYVSYSSVELFNDECPYPKEEVVKYIKGMALDMIPSDWKGYNYSTFNFESVFNKFYKEFPNCISSNVVQETISGKENDKLVMNVVSFFMGTEKHDKEWFNRKLEKVSKNKVEDPIETMRGVLVKIYNVKKGERIENKINNKNKDLAHQAVIDTLGIDTIEANTYIERYRDTLFQVGLEFVHYFMGGINVVEDVISDKDGKFSGKKGRKMKQVDKVQIKINDLKDELKEISTRTVNIESSIEQKKKELSAALDNVQRYGESPNSPALTLPSEIKELEQSKEDLLGKEIEIEMEIEELNKEFEKLKVKKVEKTSVGVKKGLFKKVNMGQGNLNIAREGAGDELNAIERKEQIEQIMKQKLLVTIMSRLPSSINVFDIAYKLNVITDIPSLKTAAKFSRDTMKKAGITLSALKGEEVLEEEEMKIAEVGLSELDEGDELETTKKVSEPEEEFEVIMDEDMGDEDKLEEDEGEEYLNEEGEYSF